MNTVGERIRMIRNSLSRQAFADKYGVHRNTLERWEKNQRRPDEGFLSALMSGENITREWLLLGEGPLHPKLPSDNADSEKMADMSVIRKKQHVEIIKQEKSEMADRQPSGQENINSLQRELREQDKEIRDLLRENGDLRVDVERKKARITELERELARVLKSEEAAPVAEVG